MYNCAIVSVGNEILAGNILNSNSQFLSKELKSIGFNIQTHISIKDDKYEIIKSFDFLFDAGIDIIFTTGGLGPTVDDLTKETAAEYFGMDLDLDEESLAHIKNKFKNFCRNMTDNNIKQAMFPNDAHILKNEKGTAPGAVFSKNNKKIIMLPGPPSEMNFMYHNYLKDYLLKLNKYFISSETIKFFGIGESDLDEKLKDLFSLKGDVTIAPYVKQNYCEVMITVKGDNQKKCQTLLSKNKKIIESRLKEYIWGYNEDLMEDVVAGLLIDKNLTISTAESCTGGLISSMLINYAGASKFFKSGFIVYSNESKIDRLNVSKNTLEKFGAVSEQTVMEMAENCSNICDTDISISISGIAGPDGGTAEKPVGLIYFNIFYKGVHNVTTLNLTGDRNKIRHRSAMCVLDALRHLLIEI